MYIIIFNPKSRNNRSFKIVNKLNTYFDSKGIKYISKNVLLIKDYKEFVKSLNDDDKIILVGGDGTFSTFINNIENSGFENDLYFFPAGTGNDFIKNIGLHPRIKTFDEPSGFRKINADLPYVSIKHKSRRFINGVGIGFDGEVAKRVNASKVKNTISYLSTALRTIFSFDRFNIELTVDKKHYSYKDVWLIAIQNGKYFGSGMMIAPNAVLNDGKLDICVVHSVSPLKLFVILPTVLKGKHLKYKGKYIDYVQGSNIKVKLDRKKVGQIDGDLIEATNELNISLKRSFFSIFSR